MPGTAYEHSAGGPFMRDINSQGDADQELYWYMNSGHVRTEPWRFGLMGPYAMTFTYVLICLLFFLFSSSIERQYV
jgi:rhamnogalacturonan endolyase